jgi:hypothetical protein
MRMKPAGAGESGGTFSVAQTLSLPRRDSSRRSTGAIVVRVGARPHPPSAETSLGAADTSVCATGEKYESL